MPDPRFGVPSPSQLFRKVLADPPRLENGLIRVGLQRAPPGLTHLVGKFASGAKLGRGLPDGIVPIVNPVARIRTHFRDQDSKENGFFGIRVRLREYDSAGQLLMIFRPTDQ